MSVLSLGLLLPFGAGAASDNALTLLTHAAASPVKHIVLVQAGHSNSIETRASNIDELLAERGLGRQPGDRISSGADTDLHNGSSITYEPAQAVTLVVDGVSRMLHTPEQTVGAVIAAQHLTNGPHDTLVPNAETPVRPTMVVALTHATSWLERIRTRISAPVQHRYDIGMTRGTQRVLDPGTAGTRETTVAVLQPNQAVRPRRISLAARILRFPRAKVVVEGVANYTELRGIAQRGIVGTFRLATAALKMIATAYTAGCSGCSGMTASGRPAGHGVVAVDPHYIPLGTHLFIPGYGHAFAGDTGGAIRGNRIDLGFDRHRDALTFGRRAIVVYVLK